VTLTLTIGPDSYRALVTPAEAVALDLAALERDAQTLALMPPAQRDAAAAALMRDALGIARFSGKTPRSASEDCSDA